MGVYLEGSFRDSSLYNVISLILIFILILVLAYFTAKLTAKLQNGAISRKTNIKIIESFRLGTNKFISIVKIGGNYYALGFGKDEITMIDRLDEESINIQDESSLEEKRSFKDILSKINNTEEQNNTDKK